MPHANRAGDVLRDRYCLVDRIDQTAAASVWRAFDSVLSRHVALYVMDADDERADRVVAAAQQAAGLSDRRLLRILDADRTDDAWLVVVEWAAGRSLEDILDQEGPLTSRRAAWLIAEVADSLSFLHQAGVVHGRLVPENVLVEATGTVRIAGACIDPVLRGLPSGSIARDVADLGGLLYAALTGRWAGPSLGSARQPAQRTAGRYLRPRQVRPGVPRVLDEVCDELVNPPSRHAHHRDHAGASGAGRTAAHPGTARGVCATLRGYVGDASDLPLAEMALFPTGRSMPRSMATTAGQPAAPPAGQSRQSNAAAQVTQPASAGPATPPASSTGGAHARHDTGDPRHDTDDTGEATQAGLPVFDDDEVVPRPGRRSAVAPPPPFEEVPERPLYAPVAAARTDGERRAERHEREDPDEPDEGDEPAGVPRLLIGVLVVVVLVAVAVAGVVVAG